MQRNESRITVFFDSPFWVCVYERTETGYTKVCRAIFGAEPKDGEVYAFLLDNWKSLNFSPPIAVENTLAKSTVNPKRRQREVKNHLAGQGVGTKAQQALALQREQNKLERKQASRQQRQEAAQLRFEQKQQKRKQKHRGR